MTTFGAIVLGTSLQLRQEVRDRGVVWRYGTVQKNSNDPPWKYSGK